MGICRQVNHDQKIELIINHKRELEINQKIDVKNNSKIVLETNPKLVQETNLKIFTGQKKEQNKIQPEPQINY